MTFKIAHLSDLHFSSWDWNPRQFFSKRWLGNLNFLIGRRKIFCHERLASLPAYLSQNGTSHLLITGDLTTTSSPAEFEKSQAFVQEIEKYNIRVFCIPGNHDQYTRAAYHSRLFYDYFPSRWDESCPYNLKEHGVTSVRLSSQWHLVGLDTALATSWFFSTGLFSQKIEKHLFALLSSFSPQDRIILVNHFPFFQHESPRKRLVRGRELRQLLEKFPQVKIYCHGHTHRRCFANLQSAGLPLIFDSGSTVLRKEGAWHQMEMTPEHLMLKVYGWTKQERQPTLQESYDLV